MTARGTALVTGASRGIGAALCRTLADLGFTVLGLARTPDPLDALAAECGVVPIVADVRDISAVERQLAGRPVDVLINNAGGVAVVAPLQEQTAEAIAETVALNLTAPLQLMRLVLPGMVARRRGHIVNITSTAAANVFAGTAVYGAAKAGLSQAGRVLRFDLSGTAVRLTEIAPGRVETEFYLRSSGGDRQRLHEAMYATVRAVKPDDIAAVVAGALLLPEHVDVSHLEVMPTDQASGGFVFRNARA